MLMLMGTALVTNVTSFRIENSSAMNHPHAVKRYGLMCGIACALSTFSCSEKSLCPPGTQLTGDAPPAAFEQWCQRRDATDTFVKNGPYKRWHKNGKLAESGRYVDNKPTGFWEAWHTSGSKAMEGHYKHGIREGRWLKWLSNGQKAGDATFKNGVVMNEVLFDKEKDAKGDAFATTDTGPRKRKAAEPDPQDPDRDWIPTARDNCPQDPNPDQVDLDQDGQGDACDDDDDGDGRNDRRDNCSKIANPNQEDRDRDGLGDICDDDRDGDGIKNKADNCIDHPNPAQKDKNQNGEGDVCEALKDRFDRDSDGDGIPDQPGHLRKVTFCVPGALTECFDNCPIIANPEQSPLACRNKAADTDLDGVPDAVDNCLLVANPDQKMSYDQPIAEGGDACYRDFDGDGVYSEKDNCPFLPNPDQRDSDKDGLGDACTLKPTDDARGLSEPKIQPRPSDAGDRRPSAAP